MGLGAAAAAFKLSSVQPRHLSQTGSVLQAATKEAMASCAEAVTRSEGFEGELAGCRGRLEGLGEGCGRCWHMLEAARVSSQLLHCESTWNTLYHHGHPMQTLESMLILGACLRAGGGAPGEVGDWTCCSWSMQLCCRCRICVWLGPIKEGAVSSAVQSHAVCVALCSCLPANVSHTPREAWCSATVSLR